MGFSNWTESIWVFLLLGIEAMKAYRANPSFKVGPYSIPTWTSPIGILLAMAALVPSSSFLGHLSGLVVGYLCKSCCTHGVATRCADKV